MRLHSYLCLHSCLVFFLFSKINANHDNQAVTSTTGGFRAEKVDENKTTPIATCEKFAQDDQIEHKIRIDECSAEAGTACQEFEASLPKGGYLQVALAVLELCLQLR